MVQIPRVDLVCDNHRVYIDAESYVFAETIPISVPSKGTREVEICGDCQAVLPYMEVVALADQYGRKPRPVPGRNKKRSEKAEIIGGQVEKRLSALRENRCPYGCSPSRGEEGDPFPTQRGLVLHGRRMHDEGFVFGEES